MYVVNLSEYGINKLKKYIMDLKNIFSNQDFLLFLQDKAFQVLQNITNQNLNVDDLEQYVHTYRNSHKKSIVNNTIYLWNETMVDLDNLNLSEETRQKYANGLSLAKIVEYGTGIVGSQSEASQHATNWEYDVNNHGNKGWFYQDQNGNLQFTRGIEGRLIFYKTKQEIEKNFSSWVTEYIKRKENSNEN